MIRLTQWLLLLLSTMLATACASNAPPPLDPPALDLPALDLPANAAPDPKIAQLSFLSGRWVCVNPNKTVNEEHWMPPRGKVLIGVFRQVRLDGKCSFVEVSQIALEEGEIVLRLRHLHGRLEVPAKRAETNLFKLESLSDTRVEFSGTGDAEGVSAVVYELRGRDELVQSIRFDPAKSKQPPFVSTYRRARD